MTRLQFSSNTSLTEELLLIDMFKILPLHYYFLTWQIYEQKKKGLMHVLPKMTLWVLKFHLQDKVL